ncbi:MAG: 5'/3'-nucleotidase SurE [Candidatus Muiribacteriota bacterium]
MNILLTNDDGINSDGIKILAKSVSRLGNVFVFAPDTERSACSSAMTLHNELSLIQNNDFGDNCAAFSVCGGYPVDCAKTGIHYVNSILGQNINFLISGINRGENTGTDLRYSGTVGASFEGLYKNIPSFAVSLAFIENTFDRGFEKAAEFVTDYIEKNMNYFLNQQKVEYVYNINYPNIENPGKEIFTRPADFYYEEIYHKADNVNSEYTLKLTGKRIFDKHVNSGTDLAVLHDGNISISLIKPEFIFKC